MMKEHFDLIITGAGVLGTFHAYHALCAGKKVLVLEKDKKPQEATVRNFGQVVPSGLPAGTWNQYGQESTALYKQIQEEYNIGIRNNGSCYIASDKEEMVVLEEMQERFRQGGYPCALLSRAAVLDKYDCLRADYAKGALWFPQEVSAEPELMIHRLQEYIRARFGEQVQFRYHSPVLQVTEVNDKVEVTIAGGRVYTAEHGIICNGRDFKILYPDVFAGSGLVVSKLNMMATKPLPGVILPGNILTGLSIRRYESFQSCDAYAMLKKEEVNPEALKWGIHILFKQRMDGSIIIGDSHEYAAAADQDDLSIYYNEMHINDIMLEEAKKIMDLPSWTIAQCWTGFYSQHDELDIFEHRIGNRVHIATGIGGKGMTTSAAYARHHLQHLGLI